MHLVILINKTLFNDILSLQTSKVSLFPLTKGGQMTCPGSQG